MRARSYIWRLDSGQVIDPTNEDGRLEERVPWQLPLGLRVPLALGPSTILARINEPGRFGDTNVITVDRDGSRLDFVLERAVTAGEELFLDYGPYYDRTGYRSGGSTTFADS